MEFWAAEVKSGESHKVRLHDGKVLHLSQASLGELKKEKSETVYLSVNVDGAKLVLGTLFSDKLPQQQFDLVFDKDFEISHNWKNGSVYFFGYKADNINDDDECPDEDSDEYDSDAPNLVASNGLPVSKTKPQEAERTEKAAGKQIVKKDQPKKNVSSEDDDTSDDDLTSDDDDDMVDDDEEDSDESDESDEETPKKVEVSAKKRPAEPAPKTPTQGKKAKLSATPQKTDGKKTSVHVATPHPAKNTAKKTPEPKSGGAHTCNSCSRNFNSDKALESHTKAKHGGK